MHPKTTGRRRGKERSGKLGQIFRLSFLFLGVLRSWRGFKWTKTSSAVANPDFYSFSLSLTAMFSQWDERRLREKDLFSKIKSGKRWERESAIVGTNAYRGGGGNAWVEERASGLCSRQGRTKIDLWNEIEFGAGRIQFGILFAKLKIHLREKWSKKSLLRLCLDKLSSPIDRPCGGGGGRKSNKSL